MESKTNNISVLEEIKKKIEIIDNLIETKSKEIYEVRYIEGKFYNFLKYNFLSKHENYLVVIKLIISIIISIPVFMCLSFTFDLSENKEFNVFSLPVNSTNKNFKYLLINSEIDSIFKINDSNIITITKDKFDNSISSNNTNNNSSYKDYNIDDENQIHGNFLFKNIHNIYNSSINSNSSPIFFPNEDNWYWDYYYYGSSYYSLWFLIVKGILFLHLTYILYLIVKEVYFDIGKYSFSPHTRSYVAMLISHFVIIYCLLLTISRLIWSFSSLMKVVSEYYFKFKEIEIHNANIQDFNYLNIILSNRIEEISLILNPLGWLAFIYLINIIFFSEESIIDKVLPILTFLVSLFLISLKLESIGFYEESVRNENESIKSGIELYINLSKNIRTSLYLISVTFLLIFFSIIYNTIFEKKKYFKPYFSIFAINLSLKILINAIFLSNFIFLIIINNEDVNLYFNSFLIYNKTAIKIYLFLNCIILGILWSSIVYKEFFYKIHTKYKKVELEENLSNFVIEKNNKKQSFNHKIEKQRYMKLIEKFDIVKGENSRNSKVHNANFNSDDFKIKTLKFIDEEYTFESFNRKCSICVNDGYYSDNEDDDYYYNDNKTERLDGSTKYKNKENNDEIFSFTYK